MSILSNLILEEKNRIITMISFYRSELATLPNGTVIIKTIKNNEYYYLQYRDGKKTISEYIGKTDDSVTEIKQKVGRRKHIKVMLKALNDELTQVNRMKVV